jgi:hippurate hydrolase
MKTYLGAALALPLLALAAPASALDVAALKPGIQAGIAADYPHLKALYEDIHSHPELGLQETRTAAKLAAEMRALGFTVTEKVGVTGIVAIYKNGPGPTIMVRTEMDALPLEEKTGLPYASKAKAVWQGREVFVDHACGHDIHMAVWVGTAKALLAQKDKWHGTLMFIGQPAEEGGGGASKMLADGLYTRFGGKPDYTLAQHVGGGEAGRIAYKSGVGNSASNSLRITFTGRGSHGSRPHQSIDPVVMAARFVMEVQTVISREKDPQAFGVVTVGSINSGTAGNIIPDTAELTGTIRTYDEAVQTRILEGVRRTAKGVAVMAGAPEPKVELSAGGHAVYNDPALVAKTAVVLKAAFGDRAVENLLPGTASEDYSEFIRAGVPGMQMSLGGLDPKVIAAAEAKGEPPQANHSPLFAPLPEPTIKAGVEAMTLSVMNLMSPA